MEFDSIKQVRDFLENSEPKDRQREKGLKEVETLFNTNLYDVISKLQKYRKDIVLMADFYPDYNCDNDFGKEKNFYIDDFGIKCSYITNMNKYINELIIVYSIMGEEGTKVPIAFKKTVRDEYIKDKTMCLKPQYLKEIELNLLFGAKYHLETKSNDMNARVLFKNEKLFSSHPETDKLRGSKDVVSVYVSRGCDAHKASIYYPKLNSVLWEIVVDNAEKQKEQKAKLVIGEIKSRKKLLGHFCDDIKLLKEDIAYEDAIIETKPKDMENRERIKQLFKEELQDKEEYKSQEKALIAHLHNEVKVLKTTPAKDNLRNIL